MNSPHIYVVTPKGARAARRGKWHKPKLSLIKAALERGVLKYDALGGTQSFCPGCISVNQYWWPELAYGLDKGWLREANQVELTLHTLRGVL